MTRIRDVIEVLEAIAPLHLQENYDNAGLIVGHPDTPLSGVVFCLDSTEAVVEEAIALGANLIVAHHPIVFRGLKRFNGLNYVERTVIRAIRENIAIYAIHTNLDNVYLQGVNAKIAEKLGLQNTSLLQPRPGADHTGAGMVGYLPSPMDENAFLHWVKTQLQTHCIRYTALHGKPIQKVALCGGAGSFLLSTAILEGADAYVSADFKYHDFFDAENKILVADVGHFESEQFTIELLFEIINEKFPNFALHCTKVQTNPVNYLL